MHIQYGHEQLDDKTKYTHMVFMGVYEVIVAWILVYLFRTMRRCYYLKIKDIYRMMQFFITIFYWVSAAIIGVLVYIDGIALIVINLSYMTMWSLYFQEIINMSCWVNLILQMNWYSKVNIFSPKNAAEVRNLTESCKKKEKHIVHMWIAWATVLILPNLVFTILIIANGCHGWNLYDYEENWPNRWINLGKTMVFIYRFSFLLCSLLSFVKITIGVILLKKIRTNLNFYFEISRKEVIMSTLTTCLMFIFQSIYTYFSEIRDVDINYRFMSRDSMETWELALGVFISSVEILMPLMIMLINIHTVNYKKYLYNLMKGYGSEQYFLRSSYFVFVTENYENFSLLLNSTQCEFGKWKIPELNDKTFSVDEDTNLFSKADEKEEDEDIFETEDDNAHTESYQVNFYFAHIYLQFMSFLICKSYHCFNWVITFCLERVQKDIFLWQNDETNRRFNSKNERFYICTSCAYSKLGTTY